MTLPAASLRQQIWTRVLTGIMNAFDERDEPSEHAQETAQFVCDELEEWLPVAVTAGPAATTTRRGHDSEVVVALVDRHRPPPLAGGGLVDEATVDRDRDRER